jgi:hypothetical protein
MWFLPWVVSGTPFSFTPEARMGRRFTGPSCGLGREARPDEIHGCLEFARRIGGGVN